LPAKQNLREAGNEGADFAPKGISRHARTTTPPKRRVFCERRDEKKHQATGGRDPKRFCAGKFTQVIKITRTEYIYRKIIKNNKIKSE